MIGFNKDGIHWQYTGMIVRDKRGMLFQAVTGSKSPVHRLELKYVPVSEIEVMPNDIIEGGND